MPADLEIPFDRVTYRHGQLLAHRDLADDKDRHDRLRWLHTHYLHATWGVAIGFTVEGTVGDGAVQVHAGIAIDGFGREIVLPAAMRVAVPTVTGPATFVLTVGRPDDADFRPATDAALLCNAAGPNARLERPAFWWRQPRDVRFGAEVPLVTVACNAGTLSGPLDFRVRRKTRRLTRPHIAWGATDPGRTGWATVSEPTGGPQCLQVTVDTSDAGFTKAPQYFAVLTGDFDGLLGSPFANQSAFFPSPYGFILDVSATGFTYRILPGPAPLGLGISPATAEERKLAVAWLGVEPLAGCPPTSKAPWPFWAVVAARAFLPEVKP